MEYVRVRQDGVEFTTTKTAVKKAMTVLDTDAVDKTGKPLPPVSHKKSATSSKSASKSTTDEA